MKILVVDPSFTMRRKLVKTLKEMEIGQPFEAADGLEAFQLLKENDFDLVLTEWNMPAMDGMGLLKSIRRNENLKETALLFVTNYTGTGNVVKAHQAKANGFIAKPYSNATLMEKIKFVMNEKIGSCSNTGDLVEAQKQK